MQIPFSRSMVDSGILHFNQLPGEGHAAVLGTRLWGARFGSFSNCLGNYSLDIWEIYPEVKLPFSTLWIWQSLEETDLKSNFLIYSQKYYFRICLSDLAHCEFPCLSPTFPMLYQYIFFLIYSLNKYLLSNTHYWGQNNNIFPVIITHCTYECQWNKRSERLFKGDHPKQIQLTLEQHGFELCWVRLHMDILNKYSPVL